jgi:hypothetical protein
MQWCSYKVCGINKTVSFRPFHPLSTGTDDDFSGGHNPDCSQNRNAVYCNSDAGCMPGKKELLADSQTAIPFRTFSLLTSLTMPSLFKADLTLPLLLVANQGLNSPKYIIRRKRTWKV